MAGQQLRLGLGNSSDPRPGVANPLPSPTASSTTATTEVFFILHEHCVNAGLRIPVTTPQDIRRASSLAAYQHYPQPLLIQPLNTIPVSAIDATRVLLPPWMHSRCHRLLWVKLLLHLLLLHLPFSTTDSTLPIFNVPNARRAAQQCYVLELLTGDVGELKFSELHPNPDGWGSIWLPKLWTGITPQCRE
jgi:hypothetical protein